MKKLFTLLLLGCLMFTFTASAEEKVITLEGVAVANFKIKSTSTQLIILYVNEKPTYFRITDIPFAVFEHIKCLPSDNFRADVISTHYMPLDDPKSVQICREGEARKSKTVKASSKNEHGFITLQPLHKSDMENVH